MFKVCTMIFFGLFMTMHTIANAAEIALPQQALDFGNEIIVDIGSGRLQDAWRKMKANSTIPPARIDAFAADYNNHFANTIQYYGPSVGVELVSQELLGTSLLRVTYLIKYEITGVAWFMYFYKVKDNWVLNEFNYDVNTNTIFTTVKSGTKNDAQVLLAKQWQHKMEQRITKMEQNYQIVEQSAVEAKKIVETPSIETPFSSVDKEAELIDLQPDIEKNQQKIEKRLARIEGKFGILKLQVERKNNDADKDELIVLRQTIALLKEKHPYVTFPK